MTIITNVCLSRELSLRDLKIADLKTKSEQTVVVSPENITAGALPSNVTLAAAQVTSGVLPLGVSIPAKQVTGFCTQVQTCLATATISANNLVGVIPAANLPSYVDDVLEFSSVTAFPAVGEAGKIYTSTATNNVYRWTGSTYVEMSAGSGNALTVPASGVQAGTLSPTVLIDSASNFGAGVISTDTNIGVSRSATATETGAGILNIGVHTSPADLVAAMAAPAVNGVFSPLQIGVRGQIPYYLFTKQPLSGGTDREEVFVDLNGKLWGSYKLYGTISGTLPPTLSPNTIATTVVPKSATVVSNSNGETYMWNGTAWVKLGGGGGGSSSVSAADVVGLNAYIANYLATNPTTATRTYKTVTSSRQQDISYTNTTTSDLVVVVNVVGGVNLIHSIWVDGVIACSRYAATSAGYVYYGTVEATVPPGSSYSYNSSTSSQVPVAGQIQSWLELSV